MKRNHWTLHGAIVGISALLLFSFVNRSTLEAVEVQSALASSVAGSLGTRFAIADFDGDHRLDVASLWQEQHTPIAVSYWIELRLSTGSRQSIHLSGPPGGLIIEARDVNRDDAVDLTVVTAWFKQPVAIFLNDGHGSFSRVEPAEFPGAFGQSSDNWSSASNQGTEAVGVPSQSQKDTWSDARKVPRGLSPLGSVPASTPAPFDRSCLISHAERAPPYAPLHL